MTKEEKAMIDKACAWLGRCVSEVSYSNTESEHENGFVKIFVNDFRQAMEAEETNIQKISADEAWKMYDFVTAYKMGEFGFISLQEAINLHYD